jgi:hypothetical protein
MFEVTMGQLGVFLIVDVLILAYLLRPKRYENNFRATVVPGNGRFHSKGRGL